MRLFVAIHFPKDLLFKIEEITRFFKGNTPPNTLKWVETQHLHLTLKFIGEVDESLLATIKESIIKSLTGQQAFEIEAGGLGMYPQKNNPRVIWLGISGGEPLIKMHTMLDQNLTALNIKRDGRAFSPHLTIARVRRNVLPTAVKSVGHTLSQFMVDPLGPITIDQVHLVQSKLTPSGPIYTILHSIALNLV